jgi:hypothetical protein
MLKDTELATVDIFVHYHHSRRWDEREGVNKSYELCQDCARAVHKVLETKPTGHGIADGQHAHSDTPTAAIQREIMGEPNE